MKKKNQKYVWIIGIIALIVLVGVLIKFDVFDFSKEPLSIGDVPTGCNVGGSGTTDNEFICPSVCDINGWDECTQQTGEVPIVIFRTNVNSLEDYNTRSSLKWIALNGLISDKTFTKTSELHLYCVTGSAGGSKVSPIDIQTIYNTRLYAYNSNLFVETYAGREILRMYELCDSKVDAELFDKATSLQSVPEYANREIFGGTENPFQCNKAWTIQSSTGSVVDSGEATYSSISSGKYQTGVKRLSAGQKFVFPGNINYAVIDTTQSCVIDTCNEDNSAVIKCVSDSNGCPIKYSTPVVCDVGEFCIQGVSGATCEAPFEESVDLSSGFTIDEPISFKYSLKSDRVTSVYLTFTLRNSNNKALSIQTVGPTSLNLPVTERTIEFNNPGLIGTYQIVVDKNYDGKNVQPEIYDFTIGNPLQMNIKIPYSDMTGSKLITGSQFYVDVGVSENGVLIPDLVQVTPTATLTLPGGTTKQLEVQQPILKNDYLRYYFTVEEAGKFTFEAKASKFGVETQTASTSAEVRLPKIDITYLNINQLTNTKPGTKTVKFETRDAFGELLNVIYEVKIVPSGASTGAGDIDVTSQVTNPSTGNYEFDYNFPSGSYVINIKASANGYPGFSELPSASINIDETGQDKECGTSEDCDAGQICNASGQCVDENPPILLYLIIVFAIVFAIVLIIIIVNLLKKRQKSVSTGLGL